MLLSKLPYLDRVVFDAAWDSAAKQTALAGFDEGLANKVEVALGGKLFISGHSALTSLCPNFVNLHLIYLYFILSCVSMLSIC